MRIPDIAEGGDGDDDQQRDRRDNQADFDERVAMAGGSLDMLVGLGLALLLRRLGGGSASESQLEGA